MPSPSPDGAAARQRGTTLLAVTASSDTDVVRGFYAAWNSSDLDGVLAAFDPDGEFRPLFGALVSATSYRGHDGIRALFGEIRGEWDEYLFLPQRLIEDDDQVVAIVRIAARRPKGAAVLEARAAYVCTLRAGRILVMEGHDADETLERLGA
jgi:ketosteroid isomerase-like protein